VIAHGNAQAEPMLCGASAARSELDAVVQATTRTRLGLAHFVRV
jgi:hypothetical protein